jgi:hypothetical protein
MAPVRKAPPPRIDYRAINAQFFDDMQYGAWNKSQPANEDEVRFSALASMCLADDDLAGSQLCSGTPWVVSNQLSLYSSFLALQAQHASSGQCRTRQDHHLGTQELPKMASPRGRRISHCPHSSTMGFFNLPRLGQTTRSRPRLRLL